MLYQTSPSPWSVIDSRAISTPWNSLRRRVPQTSTPGYSKPRIPQRRIVKHF